MKKQMLYSLAFAIMCGTTVANAQESTTEKTYDFDNTMFTIVNKDGTFTEEIMLSGIINHVSANGEYGVGYDNRGLTTNTGGAFLWKKSEPDKIELISNSYDRVFANDVSNDGIIVGGFEIRPNSETQGLQLPGYKHIDDAAWTPLEIPTEYSVRNAKGYDYAEEGRAITPDGNVIAGHIHFKIGEGEFIGRPIDIAVAAVTVWEKYGDGYKMRNCYTDLGKEGNAFFYNQETGQFEPAGMEVNYMTFQVTDISNDGNTVVGFNVADCGGYNPAFVRDDKLYQLFNCGEILYGEDPEVPDPINNFNGGTILTIDANGNMYGYFTEEDCVTTRGFVFTKDNKLIFSDKIYSCADAAGNKYEQSSHNLATLADCSEDGTVLVGAGLNSMMDGMVLYNYPKVTTKDAGQGTSVDKTTTENVKSVKIDFDGNILKIFGNYIHANIYGADGMLVKGGSKGATFDLGKLPAGTYIIKVATMNGVKTFKVAR